MTKDSGDTGRSPASAPEPASRCDHEGGGLDGLCAMCAIRRRSRAIARQRRGAKPLSNRLIEAAQEDSDA